MYGKIFDSMYDGTLAEDWRALVTFQQMIVLCDADGVVDMTPASISRRTGIPIEHIKAGIEILQSPDEYSRTEDEEGRRIVLLDEHRPWGWRIVNHRKYRGLQDADEVRRQNRIRQQRYRDNRQNTVTDSNVSSRSVTDGNGQKRHTDTDTDTKTECGDQADKPPARKTKIDKARVAEIVAHWNAICHPAGMPELRKITPGLERRLSKILKDHADSDLGRVDVWRALFETMAQTPRFNGTGQPNRGYSEPWRADLHWLLEKDNAQKTLERLL